MPSYRAAFLGLLALVGFIGGLAPASVQAADEVTVSGWFTAAADGKSGTLSIRADIAELWHIYSITQPKDAFVTRTLLKLPESDEWSLAGDFKANPGPTKKFDEVLKVNLEEHEGKVVWSAPIKFAGGVDVTKLSIAGAVYAQACKGDDECLPPADFKFTAGLRTERKQREARLGPNRASLRLPLRIAVAAICLFQFGDDASTAQPPTATKPKQEGEKAPFDLSGGKGFGLPGDNPFGDIGGGDDKLVRVKAWFTASSGSKPARLFVQAVVEPTYHIYSTTQKKGPTATKITLKDGQGATLDGAFQSNPQPHAREDAIFNTTVEEHEGIVTWDVPLKLNEGVDVSTLELSGTMTSLACTNDAGRCVPQENSFVAKLDQESVQGDYVKNHVTIRGQVEPGVAKPGGRFNLQLTATPADKWHIYVVSDQPSDDNSKNPTLIRVTGLPEGWKAGEPTADKSTTSKQDSLDFYEGPVTFTIPIDVPADAQPGDFAISGVMAYQVCASGCDPPDALEFRAEVTVSDNVPAGGDGPHPLTLRTIEGQGAGGGYATVAAMFGERASGGPITSAAPELPIGVAFGLALLGGFILNFMPCVLPVIGLKVLSIVDKAGSDRKQVFLLNVYYSIGIISVFWVLATLSVALNYGWGEQFQQSWFNIVLAGVVWVMALSFLGVWEIPIPGFVGGSGANNLQEKEGFTGSFMRGVFTTVLATPCSGPMLGFVFAFTLKQPPLVTFGLFTFMGLGLAFPYLVIGVFPQLVKWLPKPGDWMETFKQAMGFVLLGTVALLMALFIGAEYRASAFALFIGLWAACWWIGRTPLTAELGQKLIAWLQAAAFATAVALGLYGQPLFQEYKFTIDSLAPYLAGAFLLLLFAWPLVKRGARGASASAANRPAYGNLIFALACVLIALSGTFLAGDPLPWEEFSTARLEEAKAEGRTVLVDFTADW